VVDNETRGLIDPSVRVFELSSDRIMLCRLVTDDLYTKLNTDRAAIWGYDAEA